MRVTKLVFGEAPRRTRWASSGRPTTPSALGPPFCGLNFYGNGVRGSSVGSLSSASAGVVGINSSPTSFGGYFIGGLVATNGPKSAAVPHELADDVKACVADLPVSRFLLHVPDYRSNARGRRRLTAARLKTVT